MATRRFGPTRGAGVVIEEQEGQKTIEPGALGYAGYAGAFEKGPVGELIVATNKQTFTKKMGGIIPESLAPDAAHDYYDLANGAGGLLLVRVTDGNEAQAEIKLYSRNELLWSVMGTVKAANGGRWAGATRQLFGTMTTPATEMTNTTLDTLTAQVVDEWVGGYIEFDELPSTRFEIIGNDIAGVVTVNSDELMEDLYIASGGGDLHYHLVIDADRTKAASIRITDGEDKPDTEFGMEVFLDGLSVVKYANLHTDPLDPNYWVEVINNDPTNDEIFVVDSWTGSHTPAARPANHYGVSTALTATLLTATIHDFNPATVGDGDGTVALDATDDDMIEQVITLTFTAATTADAVSDVLGALGEVTVAVAFVPTSKLAPEFTITAGGTAWEAADEAVLNYKPFKQDELIDGWLFPDKVGEKLTRFQIVDNDHSTITVASSSDMTTDAIATDTFMVEAPRDMAGGKDGFAELVDADYQGQAWSIATSPFNNLQGKNLGLIKFATPGISSTAVGKDGALYAEAKNHQYRHEFPANILTDNAAIAHINTTLGRNDYSVATFPSYGDVPDGAGIKQISLTGMIHGREARIAENFGGYHKAEAGVDATLPRLLEIPTTDRELDQELLNPQGIQIIRKRQGSFILWGDRTLHTDATWRWKHQRELLSYYEQVLKENFDFLIFSINDPVTDKLALATMREFFRPEFVKRAIRGTSLDDAAIIKIDDENNTDATRDDGDLFAEVSLRLADTVERFIIKIGKQGIFESAG